MPTPTKGPRLGGGPAHERLILANLATSLFEHKRIKTTEAKAKRLRPYAERLITFAKRGDLASIRRVSRVIRDSYVRQELFNEIAPKMAERDGGYTRIVKVGQRKGDAAPMAIIELVLEPVSPKQAVVREASAATKRAAKKSAPKKAAEASVDEADEVEETPEATEAADDAAQAPAEEATADDTAADEDSADEDSAEAATDSDEKDSAPEPEAK